MKIITFTTYDNEDVQALTVDEFFGQDGFNDTDWDEFVWQDVPNKQAAVARHAEAMDAYEADNKAGRPSKDTY